MLGVLQLVGDRDVPNALAARLAAVEHLVSELDARLADGGLEGTHGTIAAERRLRAVLDGVDIGMLESWREELRVAEGRLEALAGQLEALRRLKRLHGSS